MKQSVIYGIKKADIILIAVCLLAATLLGIFFVVHRETGDTVRILYDGTEIKEIVLDSRQTNSDTETGYGYYLITFRDDIMGVKYFSDQPEPKLTEGTSYNILSVTDGMVVMEAADCGDQICVHHKPISSIGESIICLPHRLVVEIVGDENLVSVDGKMHGSGKSDDLSDELLDGVVR